MSQPCMCVNRTIPQTKIFKLFFQVYQQDAILYNILYYCQHSTCFRRFLRPSSGAQNCTHSILYMSSLLAAPLAWMSSNSPMLMVAASKHDIHKTLCVYSFELLMMGGETAWKMYSIDSNKEYCITLHLIGILEKYINDARSHGGQTIFNF